MIYYGIDPGKTTGVVGVKVEAKKIVPVMQPVNLPEEYFYRWLRTIDHEAFFVVEGFFLDPKKKEKLIWDDMPSSEIIGAVKYHCSGWPCMDYRIQKNSIKPVGYGFANLKYVAGRSGTHWQDAMAHVCFYLVDKHLAYPVNAV